MSDQQLTKLPEFSVMCESVGKVTWEGLVDVMDQNLDEVVDIQPKMVKVYPDQREGHGGYPPRGKKLNRPALIELYNVFSTKKTEEEYRDFLRRKTESWQGAHFVDYDAKVGTWTFTVEHFSGYGLTEEDEEEEEDMVPLPPPVQAKTDMIKIKTPA